METLRMAPSPRPVSLLFVLFLFIVLGPAAAQAQPPEVDDFEWLAGDWLGSMGDGVIEEIWSPPLSGTMVGMFRWSTEKGVRVYELLSIEDGEQGPVLYLRHFSSGLRPWEQDAMVLELDAYGERRVSFFGSQDGESTRLTYERTADGGLDITLEKVEGAKRSSTTFSYRRRP